MKYLLFITIFVSFHISAYTQSDIDLSQRWFNEAIYNPAATGNTFTTTVFSHFRKQWAGLEGAPVTGIFGGDMYFSSIKSAFGYSIMADKIGFIDTYNGRVSYAYYLPIGNRSAFSLGLSASIMYRIKNANDAVRVHDDDPVIQYNNISEYAPDFDFGIEYQGLFKFGAAIRHLIGVKAKDNLPAYNRSFWTYASTRLNVLYNLSFEPIVSATVRKEANRIEAGAIFYFLRSDIERTYNDRFWIGGTYRFSDQFSLMAGMYLTPKIRIGYSYDYSIGDLSTLSKSGTHEIFLVWQLNRVFYKETQSCPAYRDYKKDVDLHERFY